MREAVSHAPEALRVLIVCQGDLRGASEKQALGFASRLAGRGHSVMLSLFGDPATAAREGAEDIARLTVHWHRFRGRRLRGRDRRAAQAFAPTIVHAFNPRAAVIAASREYGKATGAPVAVHWEDDEIGIRTEMFDRSPYRRAGRLGRHVACALYPPAGPFVTRRSLDWAAAHAAGHDALTPALAEHVTQRIGAPCEVVLPITPPIGPAPDPAPAGLGEELGGRHVLMITGEMHPGSVGDVRAALLATAEVQRRGGHVAFVHVGRTLDRYDLPRMIADADVQPETARFLGYVPFARIPGLLREAAILLQPGAPSEFNRLRLPSKMQAYLAAGVPTITFAVGFAELLADRDEVLKLHTDRPAELAERIDDVLRDDALRERLAAGALRAAERLFDPERNASALESHYRRTIAGASVTSPTQR